MEVNKGEHNGGQQRLLGEKRRQFLLNYLQRENRAITGTELAELTGVSRQVIVQDIALLKAKMNRLLPHRRDIFIFQLFNHKESSG